MNKLKILHISDLHYRDTNKKEIEYIRNAFLEDIENYIIKQNLIPNFIIFSGDLVYKPDNNFDSIKVFEDAYNFFLKPICNKINITEDSIFITSGNHDINRELTKGYKGGLKTYCNTKNEVNELIAEIIDGKYDDLKHLKQFNSFIDKLSNKTQIYKNEIFQIYKIVFDKISIGIVNFNSNLMSFDDNSYGNLILGENQLAKAYEIIREFDIKIANIHHSIAWFKGFEQRMIKKFFYKNFNLVFIGHEHAEQPELVNFSDEDTLIINSASIFQGRNNINGYSLIEYSFDTNIMDIYTREYDDREHKFTNITFKDDNNAKYQYEFNLLGKTKNKKNIEIILDDIKENYKSFINKELLVNINVKNNKNINDIYIEPYLYTESEFVDMDDKEIYSINKILYSNKYVLIKGIETSGKTTILHYIANKYLDLQTPELKIPIYINCLDFQTLELTNSIIYAKIIDFFNSIECTISNNNITQLLKNGNFIFLIDNILDIDKFISIIENDVKYYLNKNKFIFTTKEDIFNSLNKLENITTQEQNSEILTIYIYSFKRDKAKKFFNLYYKNDHFDDSNDFEYIYKFITKLNIPLTVFNYTLVAKIFDYQQENFKIINEAYLLDIFMEYLLEKLDISKNIYVGSLNYALKSDYLIYLTKWMVNNNTFLLDKYKLGEITNKFFQELKREDEGINIDKFIDYMEQKGIFVVIQKNQYRFKYNIFLEFFIAKAMIKSNELRNEILKEDNILKYKTEIRLYSGLHGEDVYLINYFNNLMDNYKEWFDSIAINDGNNIYLPQIDMDIEKLSEIKQIDHETKDKMLNVKSSDIKNHNLKVKQQDIKHISNNRYKILNTNILFCNIMRNSEQLKAPELKQDTITQLVNNISKFIQDFLNKNDKLFENIKDMIDKETLDITNEEIHKIFSLLNIVISQLFINITYKELFSESLFTVFKNILENTDDNIIKLLIASLLVHSENYKSLELINKVITDVNFSKNKFLMLSLFFKIYQAIKIRDINNLHKSKLENSLVEIITKINDKSNQYKGGLRKAIIKEQKSKVKKEIHKLLDRND